MDYISTAPERAGEYPVLAEKWFDEQFKDAQLDKNDEAWLQILRGQPVNQEWMDCTNTYVSKGSISLRYDTDPETIQSVEAARVSFYEQLGWTDPEHSLHKALNRYLGAKNRPARLATTIGTMRVLHKNGIDLHRVVREFPTFLTLEPYGVQTSLNVLDKHGLNTRSIIKLFPSAIGLTEETVARKVHNLRELGLDPIQVINRGASVLGYAEEMIARRVHSVQRLCTALNWDGDASTLINLCPQILGFGKEKLRAHIALFASHGSVEWSEQDVKRLIMNALETHLIVLSEDIVYSPTKIEKVAREIGASMRKEMVRTMLDSELNEKRLRDIIGSKALATYKSYATSRIR